ncbi:12764_t:CDS:2, partial [Racocetra persica]
LGLHKGMFRRICEIAAKFYKSMHNDDVACGILTTQLINYKSRDYPFDFGYDSSKTPSLWWGVIEDDYLYLQNLTKAIFALHYYGKELSEGELHDSVLDLTTYADMENNSIELEQDEDVLESAQSNNDKLEIGLIVDFSHANFGRQGNAEELSYTKQKSSNIEFDPVAI